MEVIAGISLAASIASLLDFGNRVIRGTVEISRSADGSLDANYELEEITSRIHQLSQTLGAEIDQDSPSGAAKLDQYQESIQFFAQKSEGVSNDLLLHLQHLKARKSRRWYDVSFTSLRASLGGGRTRALEQELAGLRQSLTLFLTAQVRYVKYCEITMSRNVF